MKTTITALIASSLLLWPSGSIAADAAMKTYVGTISDSMCQADHKAMKISPDSKCVIECVKHGSKYILHDGKKGYLLSDQQTPEKFAGQKVKVTGVYYEKTNILKVDSIELVK